MVVKRPWVATLSSRPHGGIRASLFLPCLLVKQPATFAGEGSSDNAVLLGQ
jgi:hypothetical protein